MDADLFIIIVVAVLLLLCGSLILMGRGDWLISGYNTASQKKKERYNVVRLRLLTGFTSILVAILIVVAYYVDNESFVTYTVLPLALLAVVLSNTWAKRK